MSRTGALDDLIRRARRRHVGNLLLRQTVHAACAGMGGVILLLLLGTQILDWYWLAAFFTASFLFGFLSLRKRVPSPYAITQQIDQATGLHDSLSTAFFYNRLDHGRKPSAELRAAQFAEAERLARDVVLQRAVPFRPPRSLYLMAILGLVASSLFALRYGISRRLDLRPPLAKMVLDVFHFASQPQALAKQNQNQKKLQEMLNQFGLSLDNKNDQNAGKQDGAPGQTLDSGQAQETRKDPSPAKSKQAGTASVEASNEQKQGNEQPEASTEGSAPQNSGDRSASSPAGARGEQGQSSAGQQAANSQTENNSLLDKFRDAMANLLSRLKSQPRSGDSQQSASTTQGRSQTGQSRQAQGQKGSQSAGRQSEGFPNSDAQGEQEGEGTQKAQSGAGKQSGDESERAAKEGRSGIGREDGSKEIREAEQLAAMGKISEIIGKRSQNLTGEVMVEVASGNQQLRTAYSHQNATHAEAGGEIHRDEIPLAYQRYVQQYFEEIRKAPPSAAPHPRPSEPSPSPRP